eukprot:gnl/TRDRNA2_/TRDRNA2_134437_c0_seq1.p1 gnl/TRDRNA2_/TRDRNA2_134437_c0~~gnl/TRDRNA2_/TRDRNA2_134437_c0_seq1.p1  ORF type:complete len:208 (+),score=6.84 gnl/TRDRNA2_/TRDRNA2_134437_c0_seq1:41-664(+)
MAAPRLTLDHNLQSILAEAGRVATYGSLAHALRPPSSARAVGQAMRKNPLAPRVPCHRVVCSNLELGGFFGSVGIEHSDVQRKRQLLQGENVEFDAVHGPSGPVIARHCLHEFCSDAAVPQVLRQLDLLVRQLNCSPSSLLSVAPHLHSWSFARGNDGDSEAEPCRNSIECIVAVASALTSAMLVLIGLKHFRRLRRQLQGSQEPLM